MYNKKKMTNEVFGMSNTILVDSYVDRGKLDEEIQKQLKRKTHIALRGESKCGKSWLRQKNIPDGIVVQCRFGRTVIGIYTDALSQLGIKFTVEHTSDSNIRGHIEAQTSFGLDLLLKFGLKSTVETQNGETSKKETVGQDINDLRYIADIIKHSGKRLVIEDFHYLSIEERKKFAYDLKALWDYGCFVIIIGVWSQSNMLVYLNPDLTGRIVEISIYWSPNDLGKVIDKGSIVLNVFFNDVVGELLVDNCFGNVGILQQLTLLILDEADINEFQDHYTIIENVNYFEQAAEKYANQLNAFYLQFAKSVSYGIRSRKDSTGIYAHAMAVIVDAADNKLINGLTLDEIYTIAHARQPRIQKGNLRVILQKLEELQVDTDGRGLVIAYDESSDEITAVDRQLLFYRKFLTIKWPWEDLIEEYKDII